MSNKKERFSLKLFMDRIPSGMLLVPLLGGCIINTLCPQAIQFGGITTAMMTSTAPYLGLFFLCLGSQLSLNVAPKALKTGFAITIVKYLGAIAFGLLAAKVFNNNLAGLSMLAIIAGMSNSNTAMFVTLTRAYGTESDQGASAVISLNDGPFLTLIAMGAAGAMQLPIRSVIASILPLILGVIIGNLDPHMKKLLGDGMNLIFIALAFALGASMNLMQVVEGGIGGVLLALVTLLVGGFFNIMADKLTGGSGIAGSSVSSVGANAAATPAAIADVDPTLATAAAVATPQIAAAVILTAFLCPAMTTWLHKYNTKKREKKVGAAA